jgi:hypothetical protein
MSDKKLKPVHITNQTALKLIHECAPKQNRSLANCAATAIVESLGQKRNKQNPGQPAFLDQVVCKDSSGEGGVSSEIQENKR